MIVPLPPYFGARLVRFGRLDGRITVWTPARDVGPWAKPEVGLVYKPCRCGGAHPMRGEA